MMPVHVRVDEVQPGCRAPMAEQTGLGVLDPQWLAQERVLEQIDLADRQIVGRPPVGVQTTKLYSR